MLKQPVWITLCFLLFALMASSARAEFTLNFQPQVGGSILTTQSHNALSDPGSTSGQTPYLMNGSLQLPEIVTDPSNGNQYYHLIVGDIATGFIQESYVQMGYGNYGSTGLGEPATSASASGGVSTFNRTLLGNGYDPLDMNANATAVGSSTNSGNGTGNPKRMIMRQIVSDGEVMMEFLKDKYAYKPRISMLMSSPDITGFFDFDMSNSTYDDALTPGTLTSTFNLWGEGVPNQSASFDHATEAQNPYVTGGMYTYTDGADPVTDDADGKDFGGSNGTYSYTDGGSYDQSSIPWASFMDPLANNPWSWENAKVVP